MAGHKRAISASNSWGTAFVPLSLRSWQGHLGLTSTSKCFQGITSAPCNNEVTVCPQIIGAGRILGHHVGCREESSANWPWPENDWGLFLLVSINAHLSSTLVVI